MKTLIAMTLTAAVCTLGAYSSNALAAKKVTSTGLDAVEASHLTFMREEEKLARDVYLTLANMYPDQDVFNTIATTSEQTHTDTLRDKLAQLDLPDPNPDTNDLPASIGVFLGEDWGWYFTEKFHALTSKAKESELAAACVTLLASNGCRGRSNIAARSSCNNSCLVDDLPRSLRSRSSTSAVQAASAGRRLIRPTG